MRNFNFMDDQERNLLFLILAITFLITVTLHAADTKRNKAIPATAKLCVLCAIVGFLKKFRKNYEFSPAKWRETDIIIIVCCT